MFGQRSKLLAYAALSWPPHAIVYVAVPVAVSFLGERHGWSNGRPGRLNLPGGALVCAGAGLIGWAIISHYRASPDEVQFRATPNYLLTHGAYAVSRNPLNVGGGAMWAGWAVLFGSVPVMVAGGALFGFLAGIGIPFEERILRQRFGDVYVEYRSRVGRWITLSTTSVTSEGSDALDQRE